MSQSEKQRTYPFGVPSWVDTSQPNPQAATQFYGGLFGWTFTEAMPPGAPGSYLVAALGGQDAAAVSPIEDGVARWNTYLSVGDSAGRDTDATAAAIAEAGGTVVEEPWDAGPGGRTAACRDPQGAMFHLWQARRRLGVQVVNVPGAWNFSDLHTSDPAQALAFYGEVFGWVATDYRATGPGRSCASRATATTSPSRSIPISGSVRPGHPQGSRTPSAPSNPPARARTATGASRSAWPTATTAPRQPSHSVPASAPVASHGGPDSPIPSLPTGRPTALIWRPQQTSSDRLSSVSGRRRRS